jgi:hypothetical protein
MKTPPACALPSEMKDQNIEVPALDTAERSDEFLANLLAAPLVPGPAGGQIVTGHLQGIDEEGRILFVPEQGDGLPVPVAIGVALSDGVLVPAARNQQRALVVRTSENPPRLVLIGLMRERISAAASQAAPGELEVKVDGEKLRLTAEQEIELKCGKASLILRQSGRVILKGTYIVTSASGPVKIKGATIALN